MYDLSKIVIAINGVSDSGKTTLIKAIYNKLLEAGLGKTDIQNFFKEVFAIFERDGKTIGVESKGDPDPDRNQEKQIEELLGCDVIICACRTSGTTKDAVEKLADEGYKIIWITPFGCTPASNGDYVCLDDILIEAIFEIILHYTGIKI